MRNTLFILALCILAIVLGLFLFLYNPQDLTGQQGGDQIAQVASAPVSATQVSFLELEQGDYAQEVTERTNVAARDQDAFDRLWQMAHGAQELAMPEIDFSKEYVVGVFLGERASGGHVIEVQEVTDLGDTRTFRIAITEPGAGCVVTQAITSPYQLIRVPVSMHYLQAVDTATVSACE